MTLVEFNRRPSRRELLWFGALTAPFFALLGLVLRVKAGLPWLGWTVWGATAATTLLFFCVPPFRRPLYLAWMNVVSPIGWASSHLILALVYYLVLTPIGLVLRLFGRDPLQRRFDREARTYWMERKPVGDPARYFRQF